METFRNIVDGTWSPARGATTFADENPSERGSTIALFQGSDPGDVTAAVDAAARAFPGWRDTALRDRQAAVARFLSLLAESRDAIASIITRENGKTLREARAEVDSALLEGTYHQQQVSRFFGHGLPAGTRGMAGWVQYHPLGVVGVISPWNFPANVLCRKALPALLTGNTVVFKPASYTPWTGIAIGELFLRAGFPAGVFNCVTGPGSSLGNALVDDTRIRAITFTGSTEVGKAIQARAAARLVRTQLELGGKNALIVMDDADLDAAASAVLAAGFACAGQWCTSTSRLIVHEKVYDRWLAAVAARADGMKVGDPLDPATELGPVAGAAQYERVVAAARDAGKAGARRLTARVPGDRVAGAPDGYFVPPTIFADVDPVQPLFRQEVFGPVLAATPCRDLEHALALANDSDYGLSSSIFTGDVANALAYVDGIEAGMAHVNIHSGFKEPSLPFGGWKDSGYGLPENDSTGLEFFVNRKAVYMAGTRPQGGTT